MTIQAIARKSGSIRVQPYVDAAAKIARSAGRMLGSIGHALFLAIYESRAAQAERFIQQNRDLIEKDRL